MLRHPGNAKNGHRLILSLCDFSGRWAQPYREAGYTVYQYDLKHGSDVRLIKKLDEAVHGILFAPVCTAFSGAGAKHWAAKEAAGDEQLKEGLALVDAGLRIITVHKPKWWRLENPVGRLKDWIGYHSNTFNPCEYAGYLGDAPTGRMVQKPKEKTLKALSVEAQAWWADKPDEIPELAWMQDAYTKRTCEWGNAKIPKPDPRVPIWGSMMWSNYGGKSERTKELRSMTPPGYSRACFIAQP
jgi:hypothetical protein